MEIAKELAESIVKEMKKIIEKDLNFINSEGIIVASTDEKRVNTYHEGGKEVIKRGSIVRINRDGEYVGAKKGINLPVKFNDDIIGVIGISGETKEVERYGKIIKRMSEILIKEAYLSKKEEEENEKEQLFLESLISQDLMLENPIIFSEYVEDIEKRRYYSIIVCKLNGKYELNTIKNIYKELKIAVKKKSGYIMLKQSTVCILIFEKNRQGVEEFIEKIDKKRDINMGIGEIKTEFGRIRESYEEAINALEWGSKNKKREVFYEDLDIELIVKNIDLKTKKIYIKKILGNLSQKEIVEYREILYFYEKYNGSLNKISKELFIHTNTLQYKLNRLKEKIDLDMRNYEDFAKLKLAFMLS